MDMKINKEIVRRERELRAWTQSHLAEVADLSMRTVQRIERTGDVSMESASALAAAFNMELAVLMESPDVAVVSSPRRYTLWSALGLIGSTLVALGWWSSASAEQVMVSLSIEAAGQTYSDMKLLNEIGSDGEMQLDNQFRMLFNTERKGEYLLLNAKIYHFADNQYRLVSSPAMLIADLQPASLRLDLPDGQRVNFQLLADF
ncbi:MAG TPA: helix-turn-helix transcriptional regulator [Cellvibrio sp.]|nr:helix-turn-helix transcriptional regulator [Cellvibrio sp.]